MAALTDRKGAEPQSPVDGGRQEVPTRVSGSWSATGCLLTIHTHDSRDQEMEPDRTCIEIEGVHGFPKYLAGNDATITVAIGPQPIDPPEFTTATPARSEAEGINLTPEEHKHLMAVVRKARNAIELRGNFGFSLALTELSTALKHLDDNPVETERFTIPCPKSPNPDPGGHRPMTTDRYGAGSRITLEPEFTTKLSFREARIANAAFEQGKAQAFADAQAAVEFAVDLCDSIAGDSDVERRHPYYWTDASKAAERLRPFLQASGGES